LRAEGVKHLSVDEVLALHERLIERFGGSRGLRDPGLLENALCRPETGYYADLAEMATALLESLLMNHPFVRGPTRPIRTKRYRIKGPASSWPRVGVSCPVD
jgi:death-on-curing protein